MTGGIRPAWMPWGIRPSYQRAGRTRQALGGGACVAGQGRAAHPVAERLLRRCMGDGHGLGPGRGPETVRRRLCCVGLRFRYLG